MIIVFGSINMDMVVTVGRFPAPGETTLAADYFLTPGGKGANQALAAARMGVKTALVGCTGDDGFGMRMIAGLRRDGVITSGIGTSNAPTGLAVITVANGENHIVVASGANAQAKADQVPDEILTPTSLVLLQGELPAAENWTLLERAKARGAMTLLNLAPAIALPQNVLQWIDYLVVNQIEARQIADTLKLNFDEDAATLARVLASQGPTCIITQGKRGAVAVTPEGRTTRVGALTVKLVDSTGAGDAFVGTLAAALYRRTSLGEAMKMASIAASLSCTTAGAQDSYVYLGDIEAKMPELGDAVIS